MNRKVKRKWREREFTKKSVVNREFAKKSVVNRELEVPWAGLCNGFRFLIGVGLYEEC